MAKKVYLIRAAQFYKIGISADIDKRLKQIQTGCPIKCEYIGYIPCEDPDLLERQLHREFADHKTHGEWFDLGDDIVGRLISKYNLKYVVNPHAPVDARIHGSDASKELEREREISAATAVAVRLCESLFPGKSVTDNGKGLLRKMIDKYGPDTVYESLRHTRHKKDDPVDFFDALPKVCKTYSNYGRHVPDEAWACYFKVLRKDGKMVADKFLSDVMNLGIDITPPFNVYEFYKNAYNG